jgi:hypothetical protein
VVFVSGEAGIGKSTLVAAFLEQIHQREGVRVTIGHCVEQYGPGEAYLPLLEATTRLCQGPGREQRRAGLRRYAPSWLVQLPGLVDAAELAQLHGVVHGASRERMLREMVAGAERFTETRGLVVVLEDLHWSDVSTLEWLTTIARRQEQAKLMIIGTYRPPDILASSHPLNGVIHDLQARGHSQELPVPPLAEHTIAAYLAERFATGVTTAGSWRDLVRVLCQRTEGHPLFLVNMVDDLLRQGVIKERDGRWTVHIDAYTNVRANIPDSVRHFIEQQIERLSDAEQQVLAAASVAGIEFVAAEVAAVFSTDSDIIETHCEQLARTQQFLRADGVVERPDGTLSGRYRFLHFLYQEVVYTRLSDVRRLHWQRRITEHKNGLERNTTPSAAQPCGSCTARNSTRGTPPAPSLKLHVASFCHAGDYWTLSFAGEVCRVRHTLGMQYLAQLLRYPQHEFSVLDLAAASATITQSVKLPMPALATDAQPHDATQSLHLGFSDAGEHLDAQAKAAYKQRLRELREELDEAQACYDIGRTDRIQQEIDFLMTELSRAVGLGGRTRKAASPLERARVNVTLAIKTALKRITTHHPALGHYLTRTIKTGYACVYTPDPSQPVTWEE